VIHDLRIHAAEEPGPVRGEFVLYWMQGVAMRTRDNPALDFAAEQANRLGVPLLVYQGLRADYPWASDRIHTFILESAADLAVEFDHRGIQYAFYLDRRERVGTDGNGREQSPLVQLASRAALVVTEFFPTFLMPRQTRGLRSKVATPVVAVDAGTVVPVRYHDREHATAASFRPRIMAALPQFLRQRDAVEPAVRRTIELPFEPLRISRQGIRGLVADCDIDHSVSPSKSFRGGAAAAQKRLEAFLTQGLPQYDRRNDPNAGVTSGLSPYLHFGCIAPQEILLGAREAGPAQQVERFQDELLTWRELAYNFVYYNRRHRTVDAIPAWARAELTAHEADPRPVLYDLPTLESARTGDELWNAAQRAYLVDGWMHNYLRMLWGKAVLGWTANAARCLALLEHLNNKYALDGRDPSSYAGIHWIFGRFDRPFYRRPIYGTVRYQSLKAAKDKFDVEAYIRRYPPESVLTSGSGK
jgi:deoxyribodipyrimidine photo-lyase